MSDVRNYLLRVDIDKDEASSIAQSTALKLESGQITLLQVVQSLSEYINDEDVTLRTKAVTYLTQVITGVQPAFFTRQQIQVLCQFLCDRIEDSGAASGLYRLQSLGRFSTEMAVMTFRALVTHLQGLQTRPQTQRLKILELVNGLVTNHRLTLQKLGDESLVGITDLVAGEKDPRNLMLVFSILQVIIADWDIVRHAETLFESVFCYFPITFRPPPNDPYGITAQDLKSRLRECIAASHYLAPFAFPQLIERLDSTSTNVKRDVLQTITACALAYGVTTVADYSITLWDSLKYEILNAQEEDIVLEALKPLQAIATRLSFGLTSTSVKTPLATYLEPITKECNEILKRPEQKQSKPASQILNALGQSSSIAFTLITRAVLPPLLTLYQVADSIMKQQAVLEAMLRILDSALGWYGWSVTTWSSAQENPLEESKDRLFEIFSQALMTIVPEVSLRHLALKCLKILCSLRAYLDDREIGMAVQYFNEIVLVEDNTGKTDLRDAAIDALLEISKVNPKIVLNVVFPAFMAQLPDTSVIGHTEYLVTLEGLARISIEKEIADTLVRRLFNKLDVVLQNQSPADYAQALISTLHYVLGRQELVSNLNLGLYLEKVVELMSKAAAASRSYETVTALNDPTTLRVLGRLSSLIIRAVDPRKQNAIGQQIYKLFQEEPLFIAVPCKSSVSEAERLTAILSTYLLAGIERDVPIPYQSHEIPAVLESLILQAFIESSAPVRHNLHQHIALLVNKFLPAKYLSQVEGMLLSLPGRVVEVATPAHATIHTTFWIAKALLFRLVLVEEVLRHLLELLTNSQYGRAAARAFCLLLGPDEIISKENGVIVRMLAKQKIFSIVLPAIAAAVREVEFEIKANYLIALGGILRYTSTEILLPYIDIALPLFLQCLDLAGEQDAKAAILNSLLAVIEENPGPIEEHISSLIHRLLNAAVDSEGVASPVRTNSLRCLQIIPGKVSRSKLLPSLRAVNRGLLTALDDPRRNVRKEAVDCKAAWLKLDESDKDD